MCQYITNVSSHNDVPPSRRQAIILHNAGILLIGPLVAKFSEIEMYTLSFKKMHFKMYSAKGQPFCFGFHMLMKRFHTVLLHYHTNNILRHKKLTFCFGYKSIHILTRILIIYFQCANWQDVHNGLSNGVLFLAQQRWLLSSEAYVVSHLNELV